MIERAFYTKVDEFVEALSVRKKIENIVQNVMVAAVWNVKTVN